MGRRTRKKFIPEKKFFNIQPLDKTFDCPFCNHESSCDVKLDKSRKTGRIQCRVCMEGFQTTIHDLSEAIDVYCDWIDAAERVN